MATTSYEINRQIAKEIMIAYIQHGGTTLTLFKKDAVGAEQFEGVWNRILKTVSADVRSDS